MQQLVWFQRQHKHEFLVYVSARLSRHLLSWFKACYKSAVCMALYTRQKMHANQSQVQQ